MHVYVYYAQWSISAIKFCTCIFAYSKCQQQLKRITSTTFETVAWRCWRCWCSISRSLIRSLDVRLALQLSYSTIQNSKLSSKQTETHHSIPFASFHHQQPAVKSPKQFHINHLNGMNSISSWYSFIKLCVYTHQRYIMHSSRATSNKSHWRIVRKPIIIGHLLVKWQTT